MSVRLYLVSIIISFISNSSLAIPSCGHVLLKALRTYKAQASDKPFDSLVEQIDRELESARKTLLQEAAQDNALTPSPEYKSKVSNQIAVLRRHIADKLIADAALFHGEEVSEKLIMFTTYLDAGLTQEFRTQRSRGIEGKSAAARISNLRHSLGALTRALVMMVPIFAKYYFYGSGIADEAYYDALQIALLGGVAYQPVESYIRYRSVRKKTEREKANDRAIDAKLFETEELNFNLKRLRADLKLFKEVVILSTKIHETGQSIHLVLNTIDPESPQLMVLVTGF